MISAKPLQRMESEIVLKNGSKAIFRKACLALVLLIPAVALPDNQLVRPPELEPDIAFWRSIFAEVSTQQALVHDDRHLNVVYERIEVPTSASPAERRRITERALEHYRGILNTLASGKRTGLTSEEQRVLNLWPANVSNAELRNATGRLRTQMGLSDRFIAGLKRSGAWRPHIEKQLAARGVPLGLAALPHVESSYNPDSNSHVGAAGLWQFMRSTGQQFMEVDNVIDERRDPFRSSEAAAQLLAYNYSVLKSWPLAITAYNHGLGGMRRAAKQMGTQDIAVINRKYSAPSFGFASRNFYVSFLAALEVEQNAEKYFGPVTLDPPRNDLAVEAPDFIPAAVLARAFGVSEETLRSNNPALLNPVWEGKKHIPRGFTVRVPAALVRVTESQVMAALPSGQRYARQTPDAYHRVGRGESLSAIAARYDTTVRELVALNGLASQHRIRAGQNLRLPSSGAAPAVQVAAPATIQVAAPAETQVASVPAETQVATAPAETQVAAVANRTESYTVRKGDSLSTIASRTGVAESTLMQSNALRNKNRIKIGQVLYLQPPAEAPVQASAAPASVTESASPAIASASASEAPGEAAAESSAKAAERAPDKVTVAALGAGLAAGTVAQADAKPVEKAPATASVVASTGTSTVAPVVIAESDATERTDADTADLIELAGVTQAQAEYAATASLADPNDYSVADDGTIEIQATETLGHYADWLALKTQRLRDINGLKNSAQLVVGHRIKLDFSHSEKAKFEAQRIAYHREMQEAFFIRYRVTATTEHKLQAGESVWEIAQGEYNVPVWLLRQYNPDVDFGRVKPGMSIIVPKVQPVARGANASNSRPSAG